MSHLADETIQATYTRRGIKADDSWARWKPALRAAALLSSLILGLFTYWFGCADRYRVFLYFHDMGPLMPDTSPFSPTTSSRYWMAGLVASGAILLLHSSVAWLLGRLVPGFRPAAWWRVWALAAAVLIAGIPAITLTANHPTLPVVNAVQVTVVTLIGLGLALLPGTMAAEGPHSLVWLAADGWGMMLILVPATGIERLPGWLTRGSIWWARMTVASLAAGLVWLLLMTGLAARRRHPPAWAGAILLGGAIVSYLFMPLLRHMMGTDGYYYISDSTNFFATTPWFQLAIWLAAAALALGLARLRKRLAAGQARSGLALA